MIFKSKRLPFALTMGEPSGIGAELSLKAWVDYRRELTPFFLIDDPKRLGKLATKLGLHVPIVLIEQPGQALNCFEDALPVLEHPLDGDVVYGTLNPLHAKAVISSIERAVALVKAGLAGAVVTNPIHKEVLYGAGFKFPGHTEFLAELAGIETPPVMMLACDELRVVPITIHISLQEAIAQLSIETIVETALIVDRELRETFGLAVPRLAFSGLNPHAGEGGAMGREEIEVISPALDWLKSKGVSVIGPLPADTMFHAQARETYDVALCMYHDQALIPIKTIGFDRGVNVTLGLPFIRTSPDHGTALNIAGKGIASPTSLVAALKMAGEMADKKALES